MLWIEQNCALGDLRPGNYQKHTNHPYNIKIHYFAAVLNSLRYLCTKTDILSEPDKLPDEARQAVLSPPSQNQL